MAGKAVVIGAGIVGCSVALELARKGYEVRVVDKEEEVGRGSTALTSSVVRCHYTTQDAISLAKEGQLTWRNWREYTNEPIARAQYKQSGVLFLLRQGKSGDGTAALGIKAELDEREIKKRHEMMYQAGVDCVLLSKTMLNQQFPQLRIIEDDVVGLWEKDGGYVANPAGAVYDLKDACHARDVTFWLRTQVLGMHTEWVGDRRVVREIVAETPKDHLSLDADVVVNCAGPESARLNITLGVPIPMTTVPMRQYIIEGKWAGARDPLPAMADMIHGFYIRPDEKQFRIGAVVPQDHVSFSHEPDRKVDPEHMARWTFEMKERVTKRAPQAVLSDVKTYVGYYDWTVSDAYPILDSTDVGGYYVAIGTSGAWFKSAPVIGRLMAELVERREAGDDSTVIHLPRSGNDIDMRVFSSRRGRQA